MNSGKLICFANLHLSKVVILSCNYKKKHRFYAVLSFCSPLVGREPERFLLKFRACVSMVNLSTSAKRS